MMVPDGTDEEALSHMTVINIFRAQLLLALVVWALVAAAYILPWLKSLDRAQAQRAIAVLNAFRYVGLVFVVPGVVGPNLATGFAVPTAYGDLLTSLLAIGALLSFRVKPLFWSLIVAFNVVGTVDLIDAVARTIYFGVPASAGQLGAAYYIPIVYVPLLMVMHVVAFFLLLSPTRRTLGSAAQTAKMAGA